MRTQYDPGLKATVSFDDAGRIRGICHFDEYREMENLRGREAAAAYVRGIAGNLNIASKALRSLEQPVSYLDPRRQSIEYRFSAEKVSFDLASYVYYQTFLNTPVWTAGVTVTLKQAPARVVAATDTSESGIDAKLPSSEALERYRRLFATGEKIDRSPSRRQARRPQKPDIASSDLLTDILGDAAKAAKGVDDKQTTPRLIRGRFFVYRYDAKERRQDESHHVGQPVCGTPPTLPLPAVPKSIRDGSWYLVAELVFHLPYEGARMNWRMLVDVETNTIVYLRALSSGVVMGKVFNQDPVTSTGTATNTSDATNAVLNPCRVDEELRNLNPAAGTPPAQSLEGTWAKVTNITPPNISPPTRPAGSNFDIWDVRANEFAAVNAYYQVDRFFRLVADLGFPLTGPGGAPGGYFGGTRFPVEVDHRGCRSLEDLNCLTNQGNIINAGLIGVLDTDGDGIDYVYYALADLSNVTHPMGIAADWRVTLHEFGGHGILWPHVGTGQFGFAHSAGDSFAVILNDYLSKWHDGAPIDRGLVFPFVPAVPRRADRGVAEWSVASVTVTNGGSNYTSRPAVSLTGGGGIGATALVKPEHIDGGAVKKVTVSNPGTGYASAPSVVFSGGGGTGAAASAAIGTWGWGAGMDQGTDGLLGSGYLSEQILTTTMFRAYRSIGGDATSVNRREFAARYMAYLMLQAVGMRNATNNPSSAADFLCALRTAEATDWASEGIFGGAYGKVLTWAFEKQNLNNGAPPSVDVYIDDGRAGEYQYVPVHWATTTIWNRRNPDGLGAHEEPALGQTNYAYVKIKNRGTSVANDVIVKGYHCKPSAGVLWPNDLQPFTTPQLPAGTLQPNKTEEKTVGPFEWTPVVNAWGHDCMLMIVSATADASNADKFTASKVIEDWRLVPNDNNVAQRNVILAPGGGGPRGLIAGLHGKGFWVGNPGRSSATIAVSVVLPPLLAQRGWWIGHHLPADGARLKSREQRLVTLHVQAGASFTKADAEAATERDIVVTVTANGAIIGGMIYRIEPELATPFNERAAPPRGSARSSANKARRSDKRRRRGSPAYKRRTRRARKRPVS